MNPVLTVFLKEMRDGLRDRRSLLSALLFPVVGPLLIVVMMTVLAERETSDEPVELPVVGREHAPALVDHLEAQGVHIMPPPADPEEAVRKGDVDLVLVVPADFGERFRAAKPAPLHLLVDNSRDDVGRSVRLVKQHLRAHNARTGALRLLARGVDPQLGEPLRITEVDLATPERFAARLFGVIPMFVLLAAFLGGLYIATDCTAGERERGSLEPLLLNPVPRAALVVGKWLAAVVFSAVTVLFTLLFSLIAITQAPLESLGLRFSFTVSDVAWLLLATLPVALLATAAQTLVATFARSYKEAQSYLSLMVFVPTLPGVLLSVSPVQSALWMSLVPVYGQQVLLLDVIRGEPVHGASYGLAALSATLCAGLCLWGAARLFRRESIIFGR